MMSSKVLLDRLDGLSFVRYVSAAIIARAFTTLAARFDPPLRPTLVMNG
jgi:hypothetical protein